MTSFLPLDVGFDGRISNTTYFLTALPVHYLRGYGPKAQKSVSSTDREAAALELVAAGYKLVVYLTPQGRQVRLEPGDPPQWSVQPRGENYWLTDPSLDDLLTLAAWSRDHLTAPKEGATS